MIRSVLVPKFVSEKTNGSRDSRRRKNARHAATFATTANDARSGDTAGARGENVTDVVVSRTHLRLEIDLPLVEHRAEAAIGVGIVSGGTGHVVARAADGIVRGVDDVRCVHQIHVHRQFALVDSIRAIQVRIHRGDRAGQSIPADRIAELPGCGQGEAFGPQGGANSAIRTRRPRGEVGLVPVFRATRERDAMVVGADVGR